MPLPAAYRRSPYWPPEPEAAPATRNRRVSPKPGPSTNAPAPRTRHPAPGYVPDYASGSPEMSPRSQSRASMNTSSL